MSDVSAVPLPPASLAATCLPRIDYADAYLARLPTNHVFDRRPDELLLGENDRHLDFRVSVLLSADDVQQWVTVSTVVCVHNAWGRAYFALVRPFHQLIVPTLIRHALRGDAAAPTV